MTPGSKIAVALALVVALVALVFFQEGRFSPPTTAAGNLTVSLNDFSDVLVLINPSATTTSDRFESFDSPLGTSYSVPARRTLTLGLLTLAATSSALTVQLGYGDTHVEGSAAAPDAAVTLIEFTLPIGTTLQQIPLNGDIPTGKHPWIRITGATWSRVTVAGVER